MTILLVELSTFFMNIRWRLLKHKMADSSSFVAVSVAFMAVFFGSRIIFMPMLNLRLVELNNAFPLTTLHPI